MFSQEIDNELSLANFKIGNVIGAGGYAKVYSAFRIKDNKPVALKEVPIKHQVAPQEIRLLEKVYNVPGVIKILGWFEIKQSIEEYIELGYTDPDKFEFAVIIVLERPEICLDLFSYLNMRNILAEDVAKDLFKRIFKTTRDCFNEGVIHGDVKDENILVVLDQDSNIQDLKLIDFGAGSFVDGKVNSDFRGTLVYAPPEIFNYGLYNGELATVWSLGILLYNMLCGNVPWQEHRLKDDMSYDNLPFPSFIELSKDCHDLLRICLREETKRAKFCDIADHVWMS